MTEIDNEADIQVRNTVAELLNTQANDVMSMFVVGEAVVTRLVHSHYCRMDNITCLSVLVMVYLTTLSVAQNMKTGNRRIMARYLPHRKPRHVCRKVE
jgi:hypothetical protein